MRKPVPRVALQDELILAIGLVWGHLNAGQFEQADQLARGCLRIWPDEARLMLMAAFAAVELARPLTPAMRAALDQAQCNEWAALVLRRAVPAMN